MVSLHGMKCCGIFELNNISSVETPREVFEQAMWQICRYAIDFPFILFSGVVQFANTQESHLHVGENPRRDNYGEAFAKFIEENGVGTVVRSDVKQNWSDNLLQIWIWQIDRPKAYRLMNQFEDEAIRELKKGC